MDVYFENLKKVLDKIENTQRESILKSADVIAESLTNNGMFHLLDTGHMLMYEGVGRSGGLMAVRPIRITFDVNNPTRFRQIEGKKNVLIGSVSGMNILPVEMAIKAKEMGVHTIALTSVEYSKALTAKHKSGKMLYEVCDHVLDNCGNVGDSLVYVEDIDKNICPSSGLAASYLMWALQAEIVSALIKRGKDPSIYISNHLPNASKINNESWGKYEKFGY